MNVVRLDGRHALVRFCDCDPDWQLAGGGVAVTCDPADETRASASVDAEMMIDGAERRRW